MFFDKSVYGTSAKVVASTKSHDKWVWNHMVAFYIFSFENETWKADPAPAHRARAPLFDFLKEILTQ